MHRTQPTEIWFVTGVKTSGYSDMSCASRCIVYSLDNPFGSLGLTWPHALSGRRFCAC
eukprot:m.71899 g.71899  ORF g.71899 m.71899 type:complete len:58 (-) comp12317_c0_seq1:134-307(-)